MRPIRIAAMLVAIAAATQCSAAGGGNEKPALIDDLWGFADLHAHPAFHLAYGADERGNGGVMWGKPGMALEDDTIDSDLHECDPTSHGGSGIIRGIVMGQLAQQIGAPHGSGARRISITGRTRPARCT